MIQAMEVKKLGDFCNFTQGVQIADKDTIKKPAQGYIRYIYIRDLFSEKYKVYVKDQYPQKILSESDIVMVNTGNTSGSVYRAKRGVLCNNAFKISIKKTKTDELDNNYLWVYLNSAARIRMLKRLFNPAGQPHVGHKNVSKLEIPIPPLPEQQKIAKILQTWDRAIATTEKLIDASKQQKKALMQQLLTGKKRFPGFEGEWESVRLGEVFNERLDTGYNELPLLSITSEAGVISRDGVGRKDTSNTDKQKYKRICPGDIGYNTMRMWQGVSGLSALEGIVSPAYTVVVPTSEISPEYTSYLFKLPSLVNVFTRNSQGLVSDTWNLKFKHFAKIKWTFPSLTEQIKISTALLSADNELGVLQKKLIHLKGEKKALMQQLLTGKRRVKIDD